MSATQTAGRRTGLAPRFRGVLVTGVLVALGAAVAATLGAALARAAGVDLVVQGDEAVPVAGIGVVTGVCSLAGVVLAVALLRWSARPAEWFVRATVALTAISLVPPVLWGSAAATAATLVALHLLAAVVVVPALARRLRSASGA
jgi:hypothetical protein